jgi:phospholipid-binding lipoprotein MlaA
MFLPLVGPTTLRDLVGGGLDRLVLPLAVGTPFDKLAYSIPTGVLSMVDHRVEFDEQLNRLRNENTDPYTAAREFYLQRRQAEIDGLRGRHHEAAIPVAAPPAQLAPATAAPPTTPPHEM